MTNNGRLKVIPSVFAVIFKDHKVLLMRRANTGWLDGWYDLPAGHLENQEKLEDGVVRELAEETGLTARAEDLQLIHVYQNHHNPEAPHYGYIFLAKNWNGSPTIIEKDKCDDIGFFETDKLPEKIAPYVKEALRNFKSGSVSTSYHSPGSIDA